MESGRTTRRKRTVLLILMSRALEICLAMLLATFPVQESNGDRERGVGIGQKEREFKIEIDTFVSLTLSSFVVNPFCVPSATRQDKECECESECECVWRIWKNTLVLYARLSSGFTPSSSFSSSYRSISSSVSLHCCSYGCISLRPFNLMRFKQRD